MTHQITNWINRNVKIGFIGNSNYLSIDNVVVRISNHLPVMANFEAYNEGCNKIVLVFLPGTVKEIDVQKFIERNDDDYSFEYFILDENCLDEYSEMILERFLNK